jgi:hypothetical protein
MVGKASLLLVLGFSLVFLVFGQRFGNISSQAVDNMVDYYSENIAYECAAAGAKMAANKLYLDQNWRTGFNNLSFNGGTINVTVNGGAILTVTSVGTFTSRLNNTTTYRDVIKCEKGVFSRYAYYSTYENDGSGSSSSIIWWTGNDTVWGPFHTQDFMYAYNHPVFKGRATTGKSYILYDYYNLYPSQLPQNPTTSRQRTDYNRSKTSDLPVFEGGYQGATDIPLPTGGLDPLKTAAQANGLDIPQTTTTIPAHMEGPLGHQHSVPEQTVPDTIYITFMQDSVLIKKGYAKPSTTYKTSEIAPNGVIYAEGMDVRLEGTVSGKYSVASEGDIYLDDDIVYTTNPETDPNCTDLLGIVSQNNVYISENTANNSSINIDAAIYCQTGGFGAENYASRPFSGYINLIGGITQYQRKAVGTFGGHSNTGFYKRYKYDQRLYDKISPPYFPSTKKFIILSWLEERVNN